MNIDPSMLWNIGLTLIVGPFAWAFSKMFTEVKRLQILLNRTREEMAQSYATKSDLHHESTEVMATLRRLEDKLDRFIEKNG